MLTWTYDTQRITGWLSQIRPPKPVLIGSTKLYTYLNANHKESILFEDKQNYAYISTHFQVTLGASPPVLRLHNNVTTVPSTTVPIVGPLTSTSSTDK